MSHMWTGHVADMKWSCHTYGDVMSHTWTSHVTHVDPEQCQLFWHICNILQHSATHCNTLQYTATHCNTLQHTATHCNTGSQLPQLFQPFLRSSVEATDTATHCDTLQHTHAGSKLPQLFKPFLRSSVEATVKQYKNYLSSKLMSVSHEQNTKTQQTHKHTHTHTRIWE